MSLVSKTYTKFGEYTRILRTKRHETMEDMCRVLNVSRSCLSSVEHGKRRVPPHWIDLLVEHYKLDDVETSDLLKAIDDSCQYVKIDLTDADDVKKHCALQFSRVFNDLNNDDAEYILKIFSKYNEDNKYMKK